MNWQVAVPAYGRDYKTAKQVKEDWAAGKDFRCEPQGCYINKQDADQAGITVELRYKQMRELVVIKPAKA